MCRLRSRNEELETEAEKLREQLLELEENKADLTSHLQRYLDKKSEEAQELQERLVALEKRRKFEQEDFKKREEQMEREFRAMENNLTAEIKLAGVVFNYYLKNERTFPIIFLIFAFIIFTCFFHCVQLEN